MGKKRQPLQSGYHLILGGMDYEIKKVEGMGGNAIVYRACYEDGISKVVCHYVLIKELFPYENKGWIFRQQDGKVGCKQEGNAFFERHRQSFYRGNQANLELLEKDPDQIAGNLNSYEAYGTIYSVLTLHGGKTLKELLEKKERFQNLREITQCIIDITEALEIFHENGFLYLDISPDNILVMKKRVLLIDYNSLWSIERKEKEGRYFSVKEGYSAAEVRLKSEKEICAASDVYSVCSVFFEMAIGKKFSDEEILGNGLKKSLKKAYQIFADEPVSAIYKMNQILRCGLHPVVRMRYQSAKQLKAELEELVQRIEGMGITHSALWESSRLHFLTWQKQFFSKTESSYLDREIQMQNGQKINSVQLRKQLEKGEKLLLKGNGGMGKTSFLRQLWEDGVKSYNPQEPVICYIALADYQQAGQDRQYIKKYLLRQLCLGQKSKQIEDGIFRLQRLFQNLGKEMGNIILLLDGLNEAGGKRKELLLEIEEISAYDKTGILITDRQERAKQYGMKTFQTILLQPLTKQMVCDYLQKEKITCPQKDSVIALLQNPMMMKLYEQIAKMIREDNICEKQQEHEIDTEETLIEAYFQNLSVREQKQDSGNEQAQLCYAYLSEHLLPDIATQMKRKRKSVLKMEELYSVTRKSYRNLKYGNFTRVFEEYLGKSRVMLQGIENEREWFDYAIFEELIGKSAFLEKTQQGGFRLIHENFTSYLQKKYRENRKKFYVYKTKRYAGKGAIGIILMGCLLWTGKRYWEQSRPFPYFAQEVQIVEHAMSRLTWNLGILDAQLNAQFEILDRAMSECVTKKDSDAEEELKEWIERKEQDLESMILSARDGKTWVEELEIKRNTIPLDILARLYERPRIMQKQMEAALGHIKENLCQESPYQTQEQRKKLIEAYEEYLMRYTELCYIEIQYVLQPLGEDAGKEVTDFVIHSSVFGKEMIKDEISGKTQEQLKNQLKAAENAVLDAENKMKRQNYEIVT